MNEIIQLEKQGFRFASRRQNGLDRFDYIPPGPLTAEQVEALIVLVRNEKAVCKYLVDRAKAMLKECREIAKGD